MNRDELAKYLLDKFPDTLELLETGKAEPFFAEKAGWAGRVLPCHTG